MNKIFIFLLFSALNLFAAQEGFKISGYPNKPILAPTDLFITAAPGITNNNISYVQFIAQATTNILNPTNFVGFGYDTIQQLQGRILSQSGIYTVAGRTSPTDNGGGLFYFDINSALTTNAGTIFAIPYNNAVGRLIRIYSTELSPMWFGATGDGVSNDYLAVQATIYYGTNLNPLANGFSNARLGNTVKFPAGFYVSTNGYMVPAGVDIVGQGNLNTCFIQRYPSNCFTYIKNPSVQTIVPNVFNSFGISYVNGSNSISTATANTHAIHIEGDINSFSQPIIKNLLIGRAGVGIYLKYTINAKLDNVNIRDGLSDGLVGDGFNTDATISSIWPAANSGYGYNWNGNSCTFISCASDGNTGGGALFKNCLNLSLISCSYEANSGNSLYLSNCQNAEVTSPLIAGLAITGRSGIVLDGGLNINISLPTVSANGATSGYGIVFTNISGSYPFLIDVDYYNIESFGLGICNAPNRLHRTFRTLTKIETSQPGIQSLFALTNAYAATSVNHGVELDFEGANPLGRFQFFENPQLRSSGNSLWQVTKTGGVTYWPGISLNNLGLVGINNTNATNNLDIVGDSSITGTLNTSNIYNKNDFWTGNSILVSSNQNDLKYASTTLYGSTNAPYSLAVIGSPSGAEHSAKVLLSPFGGGYSFTISNRVAGFADMTLNGLTLLEMYGGAGPYIQLGPDVVLRNARTPDVFTSTATTGSGLAPFLIASTILNTNLNADLLDDHHGPYYLDLANATGILPPPRLPTGLGITNNGGLLSNNIVAGGGVTITKGASGQLTITSSSTNGGTVTNVALSAPAVFTVTGSPITTGGTLGLNYSGLALPLANGGTSGTTKELARTGLGLNTGFGITNNGNLYSNNIVAGPNIIITNGANGQLTISSSGGTNVPSGDGVVLVHGGVFDSTAYFTQPDFNGNTDPSGGYIRNQFPNFNGAIYINQGGGGVNTDGVYFGYSMSYATHVILKNDDVGGFKLFTTPFGQVVNIDANGDSDFIHIGGNMGGTPLIAKGPALGAGPSNATLDAHANDTAMTITIVVGTTPLASGVLFTVTFANPYLVAPHITFSPSNDTAVAKFTTSGYPTGITTTQFTFNSTTVALTPGDTFVFTFHVIK